MGRIARLEVSNYKSYKGDQVIGPFKNLTAVIGPNGCGKSNLMDAVSFGLGVHSRHLRSKDLRHMIYDGDGRRADDRRRASVTIVYEVSDGELAEYNEGFELRFTRTISPSGVSSYRLGQKDVTWAAYNEMLKRIGCIVKARNFLVFQGDVENIASKDPKQLSHFFGEISGANEFAEEYDQLKGAKEGAQESTIFTFQQKKGVIAERKLAKEQKAEADKFDLKRAELAELKQEYFLWQLYHVEQELEERKARAEDVESELEDAINKEHTVEAQLNEKKKAAAGAHQKALSAEKRLKKQRSLLADREPSAIRAREAVAHLKKKAAKSKEELAKRKATHHECFDELKGLERDIARLGAAEEKLKSDLAAGPFSQGESALTKSDLTELEGLQEEARTKTVALRAQISGLEREQSVDNERLATLQRTHSTLAKRRTELEQERASLGERRTKMQHVMIPRSSALPPRTRDQHSRRTAAVFNREAIASLEVKLKDTHTRLTAERAAQDADRERRTAAKAELDEAARAVALAKADRAETKRERQMRECIEDMMRLFDGQ